MSNSLPCHRLSNLVKVKAMILNLRIVWWKNLTRKHTKEIWAVFCLRTGSWPWGMWSPPWHKRNSSKSRKTWWSSAFKHSEKMIGRTTPSLLDRPHKHSKNWCKSAPSRRLNTSESQNKFTGCLPSSAWKTPLTRSKSSSMMPLSVGNLILKGQPSRSPRQKSKRSYWKRSKWRAISLLNWARYKYLTSRWDNR